MGGFFGKCRRADDVKRRQLAVGSRQTFGSDHQLTNLSICFHIIFYFFVFLGTRRWWLLRLQEIPVNHLAGGRGGGTGLKGIV